MRSLKIVLLWMCRLAGLFELAKWLTRKHLKIICYHGFALADETEFRPKLFIAPDTFEQRLATMRRFGCRILPLSEAIDRLYARALPKHAVVITIDDGFHSVYSLAMPCLQRYGFPATVYLTTYYVDKPNPIFRLVVQYMFWKTRKRELVVANVSWSANRIVNLADPVQREQAMWACINYGERECTEEMRCTIAAELGDMLATPYIEVVNSRILSLMTPDELRCLGGTSIDVELHTHRHVFPSEDQSRAEREITDNRAALARWLSAETTHFCYPSGMWDERQWAWLDGMRIKSSTTCDPGLNSHKTPRHALRRFLDGENIHQLEFEAALSGFSDLLRNRVRM